MAKDPAFLFYSSDFLTGTMFMDDAQVGKYIRLLCAQHQHGGMIERHVFEKIVGDDTMLRSKFEESEAGFFNPRLGQEMDKRQQKSSKMAANAKQKLSKSKAIAEPIENENENITDTVFKGGVGENWNQFPKPEDVPEIPEIKQIAAKELLYYTQKIDISPPDITGLFRVFCTQHLTGKKFYQTRDDVYSHFLNWLKTQKFNDAAKGNTNSKTAGGRSLIRELLAQSEHYPKGNPGG